MESIKSEKEASLRQLEVLISHLERFEGKINDSAVSRDYHAMMLALKAECDKIPQHLDYYSELTAILNNYQQSNKADAMYNIAVYWQIIDAVTSVMSYLDFQHRKLSEELFTHPAILELKRKRAEAELWLIQQSQINEGNSTEKAGS